MKKTLAMLCVLLLMVPGLAAAGPNWTYVQVAELVNEQEISCYLDFTPDFADDSLENVTVHATGALSQETVEAIEQQQIALIAPVNYDTTASETSVETEGVEPAVFYAVINPWSDYNEEANSVVAYVCNLAGATIDLPDSVDVKKLVTEGETRKVIMFAPYAVEGERFTQHVSTKEILFPAFACGYVTDFGSDYLEVDTLPYDEIRAANQNATPTPMRFTLTDNTLAAELIEDEIEIVVVYDENTMEAVALFFFYG